MEPGLSDVFNPPVAYEAERAASPPNPFSDPEVDMEHKDADGAIRDVPGECVDVAGANSANGTPVQLNDCTGR